MDPSDITPHTAPAPKAAPEVTHPLMQTYESDLQKGLDTTDARTVQALMEESRERERAELLRAHIKRTRGWYVILSLMLLIAAAGAGGYGAYHYLRLTVPVERAASVGVFPSMAPVVIQGTTVEEILAGLDADKFAEHKPTLVPLITDVTSRAPLAPSQFFAFIKSGADDPFVAAASSVDWGVVREGNTLVPFVIASLPNPPVARKEFLINESNLVKMFARSLSLSSVPEAGSNFVSEYTYNIPVRVLRSATGSIILLYGYPSDNTVVFTASASAIADVYNTLIAQQ